MPQNSIYRSSEGKKILIEIYDNHLSNLNVPFRDLFVQTRFGRTHVVNLGNKNGIPLICLHGGNSNTPDMLTSNKPLFNRFNIFAIDLIGHPGKSDETRLSSRDLSYGKWLLDVINELQFESVNIYAGSFGAGIAVRLGTVAPNKINKMSLIVPAGVADESLRDKARLMIPYFRYKLHSTDQNLIRLCSTLMTRFDPERIELLQAIFKHVKINPEMPRPAYYGELDNLFAPVMVIAAKNDILFPAARVIPRAKKLFPNLVYIEAIDSLHEPSQDHYAYIHSISAGFFEKKLDKGSSSLIRF